MSSDEENNEPFKLVYNQEEELAVLLAMRMAIVRNIEESQRTQEHLRARISQIEQEHEDDEEDEEEEPTETEESE